MHVTIVGGGFGGIKAALEIAKDRKNTVTLISDKPDFQYYPTLYSSATGHSHLESWAPLGEIFADHPNIYVYIDTIEKIDAKAKTLHAASGTTYSYETVIFALGVVTTYFGIPGLETYTYGIKSEAEIKQLKQRLFIDIAEKGELDRNYVVIGAGPTGVELSAAIGTYIKRLCKYYRVKHRRVNVRLIEASPRVLPRNSEQVSRVVKRRLERLGVKVETGRRVEAATPESLVVDGQSLDSHTVIWTSGVSNSPFFAAHPKVFTLAKNGRVVVDEYLSAGKDIYVIGDNAATKYTGLAQTAVHNGTVVARNLRLQASGKRPKAYKPRLPASAVPVGRGWAVIEWRWIRVYGWLGSLIRRAADIIGYHDTLPIGTSFSAWRAAYVYEHDYFTPSVKVKSLARKNKK
ncbi:MAG: FAD-dependent oxidoreductase [Candidatus Saccharimonas sp.]